ncbi:hypothetical protein CsSME_00051233 [Camellia sinensis var. sinensis]
MGKQRAEATLPLSSERPRGRQRRSHPIRLATAMSVAYCPLFGASPMLPAGCNCPVTILRWDANSDINISYQEEEEPLEKLLEVLGTYNLVSLVKEGLMKTPTILASLYKHAEIDPTLRHIVAYRIGPYFMTNRMIVNSVFEKYGEIERCRFDEDGVQVLFKHRNSAWKVLKEPYLKIGDYLACDHQGAAACIFGQTVEQ